MAEALALEVTKGITTEATTGILMTVASRIASEIQRAWAFQNDLKKLQRELRLLECYRLAVDETNNPVVQDWIRIIKNVAYDVDDLLDEYAYEMYRRELKKKKKNRSSSSSPLGASGCISKTRSRLFSFSYWRMARKFKGLMTNISTIYEEATKLGIKPVKVTQIGGTMGNNTIAIEEEKRLRDQRIGVNDQGLIGRDQDVARIIQMLRDPSNQERHLTIVAIIGLAGLGKTAIAKRVFRKENSIDYFQKSIWLTVSHEFEVNNLLKKMAESLFDDAANIHSISEDKALIDKIRRELKGKRYLLILDDVWDTMGDKWDHMRPSLQDMGGSMGTTILVTSRTSTVVETMEIADKSMINPLIYELDGLKNDESWFLFKISFGDRPIDSTSEQTAKRMVQRCQGVPLAIKALGGLLKSQHPDKWDEIEMSKLWSLEDKRGILPTIKLSFNYLPCAQLKQCFSYCAVFQEDARIEKEDLILQWMAQGYLHGQDNDMEDIGEKYFSVLLSNYFLQEVEWDEVGNVKSCKMHDLVHALAKAVSRHEWLDMKEGAKGNNYQSCDLVDARHLCVHSTTKGLQALESNTTAKVRTLLTSMDLGTLLIHFKHLRVLSMVDIGLKVLPASVCKLIHLKYLNISYNEIMGVPETFSNLYNLQTLRMFSVNSSYNNPILRHGLENFVNLRHIIGDAQGIQKGLKHMASLRTLPKLDLRRKWGGKIDELGPLNNLKGRLEIDGLEHVSKKEEAKSAHIMSKSKVEQLVLKWSVGYQDGLYVEDVLEGFQPHRNLKTLEIYNYTGQKSLDWKDLVFLEELVLFGCSNMTSFPDLQGLTYLRSIKIQFCTGALSNISSTAFQGCSSLEEVVVEGCSGLAKLPDLDGLTSLLNLTINDCKGMKCISTSGSVRGCSSLKELTIKSCPMLSVLPNLNPLQNLQELIIKSCEKITSLPNGLASLPNLLYCSLGPFNRDLDYFPFLTDLGEGSPISSSLQRLALEGWRKVKVLPRQLQNLCALQWLDIQGFGLEAIPEWLGDLASLRNLCLVSMLDLKFESSQHAVQRLDKLKIKLGVYYCPLMEP